MTPPTGSEPGSEPDAEPGLLVPGTPVRQEYTKYDGSPHWVFETVFLGSDRHGHWIGGRPGDLFTRPGREFRASAHYVTCIPRHGWWVATFNDTGSTQRSQVYVDVTTPSTWHLERTPVRVAAIDLDLDVIRRFSGEEFIDDEDEFAEHQITLGYPPDVRAAVRRTADDILARMGRREEPYAEVGLRWIAIARGLLGPQMRGGDPGNGPGDR